jgi:hypothetical protein
MKPRKKTYKNDLSWMMENLNISFWERKKLLFSSVLSTLLNFPYICFQRFFYLLGLHLASLIKIVLNHKLIRISDGLLYFNTFHTCLHLMADLPPQVSQYSKGISQLSNACYKPFPRILQDFITLITNKQHISTHAIWREMNMYFHSLGVVRLNRSGVFWIGQ